MTLRRLTSPKNILSLNRVLAGFTSVALAIGLSVVAVQPASAAPPVSIPLGGVVYTIRAGGKVTVSSATGATGRVVIPETVNLLLVRYSVVSIADYAFYGNTNVTSIKLPSTVQTIGTSAFSGATNLAAMELGSGLTSIGEDAFAGDTSLTSLTIPSGMTSIGARSFRGMSLSSVTIPSGVTSIGASAFAGNSSLSNVYFNGAAPSVITEAGETASLGTASGLTVHFNRAYQSPTVTDGFTTPTWKGYSTDPNPVAVNYSANTGTGTPSVSTQTYTTEPLTLPTVGTMAKAGYLFQGWSTTAGDGNGTGGTVLASPYSPTSPITLYAVWALAPQPFATAPTPTITGTATVDETLTAVPGAWSPTPSSFSYQWLRAGVAIGSATASTYQLTAADAGAVISVTVTGSKAGYVSSSQTSVDTSAVADADFVLTPLPTITGVTEVGAVLTADPGSWFPAPDSFNYVWKRDGDVLPGGSASTYVLNNEDLGGVMTVTVTGVKAGYSDSSETSFGSAPISTVFETVPIPVISGTTTVGNVLSVACDSWSPAPDSCAYQWFRGSDPIADATQSNYTLTADDLSTEISVAVTGSKTWFASATQTSASTSPIAAGLLTKTPKPTVSGTAAVGETLTVASGSWDSGVALSYRWMRGTVAISGATDTSYVLTSADLGQAVSVRVTGSKAGYVSFAKYSAAIAPVSVGALTLTPTPTIVGTTAAGRVLVATAGSWDTGTRRSFQWFRGETAIPSATGATYTLTADDVAFVIKVKVTGSKAGYSAVTRSSDATTPVQNGSIAVRHTPTIVGTATVGETVSASTAPWSAGTTLAYQWLRNRVPIGGANDSSYVLTESDVNKRISVRVTGSQPGYYSVSRTSEPSGLVAGLG